MGRASRISCFFAVFLGSLRASAEPPRCPDRAAVAAALTAIMTDDEHAAAAAHAEWQLEDLGERYRISVGGRVREYSDPARNCRARAQVAAVFIMLSLNGDETESEQAGGENATKGAQTTPNPRAAPAPPEPVEAREPAPSRSATAVFPRFELDGGISGALAEPSGHETAVLVRGGYSWSAWGVELGAAVPITSARLEVGAARAELTRYPFDFSARYALMGRALRADVSAGVELAVLRLRDTSQGAGAPSTRFTPGARVGAALRLSRPRVSPIVGVFSAITPLRYDLALEPTGTLAKTPPLWLGAWIGLAARFD